MKVYIKPWEEVLKSAKEFDERLVDTVDGIDFILGILPQCGDWGRIVEAEKNDSDNFDSYYAGFHYPVCCAEEITPEWLEEHAEVFAKDRYIVDTSYELTDCDYCQHFNIIYKVKDTLNTYFFYVHKFYERGCENPVITDFREIK